MGEEGKGDGFDVARWRVFFLVGCQLAGQAEAELACRRQPWVRKSQCGERLSHVTKGSLHCARADWRPTGRDDVQPILLSKYMGSMILVRSGSCCNCRQKAAHRSQVVSPEF